MNFKFIGWCQTTKSDKVWGVIAISESAVLIFWGRRGAKLQTKISTYNWDISKLIDSKISKGYIAVNKNGLDKVYPEFQRDLEKTTIWATLKI